MVNVITGWAALDQFEQQFPQIQVQRSGKVVKVHWIRHPYVPKEILVVGDKIAVFLHFQAWPKGGGEPREGHIADVYTLSGREGRADAGVC